MKPIQVYVDEEEFRRLDEWASKRGWTKSQAVRAAIRGLVRGTSASLHVGRVIRHSRHRARCLELLRDNAERRSRSVLR